MVVDTGYLIFDTPAADLVAPVRSDRDALIAALPPGAAAALAVDAARRVLQPATSAQDSAPSDRAASHIADVSRKAFAGQLQDSQFDNGAR